MTKTHIFVILKVLRELLPDGREGLAMPAPRRIKLDKDVLIRIKNSLVEIGIRQSDNF